LGLGKRGEVVERSGSVAIQLGKLGLHSKYRWVQSKRGRRKPRAYLIPDAP